MKWIFVGVFIFLLTAVGAWFLLHEGVFRTSVISPLGKSFIAKPLDKYTIENLSRRAYPSSQIILDAVTATTSAYTVYSFHFESDGKKATGVAYIPVDATPAHKDPVIVQFRGYVDKTQYFPGDGTQHSAEVYATNGFISLAPDFLGYGGSDSSSPDAFEDRFLTYTTALNLFWSVSTLPMADSAHVGIWGHSNGGQIALTVLEILGSVGLPAGRQVPSVLWAPVSKPFPYSILYYTDDIPDHGKLLRKVLSQFESNYDAERYSLTNYLDRIKGPLQIQQGSLDTEVPQGWSDTLVKALGSSSSATIRYFVYSGADHNMTGAWNTVVARDVEFFNSSLKK